PDIDELFKQQADERDPKKREELLYKIQQLTIDRVMYAPVMDLRVLMGIGPRVAKHTITDIWMSPFPSYGAIARRRGKDASWANSEVGNSHSGVQPCCHSAH